LALVQSHQVQIGIPDGNKPSLYSEEKDIQWSVLEGLIGEPIPYTFRLPGPIRRLQVAVK